MASLVHYVEMFYLVGILISVPYLMIAWIRMGNSIIEETVGTGSKRHIRNPLTISIAILIYILIALASNKFLDNINIEDYAYWYCGNESPTLYYLILLGPYGWVKDGLFFIILSLGVIVSFYRSISANMKIQRIIAGILCVASWIVIGCLNTFFMGWGCAISRT